MPMLYQVLIARVEGVNVVNVSALNARVWMSDSCSARLAIQLLKSLSSLNCYLISLIHTCIFQHLVILLLCALFLNIMSSTSVASILSYAVKLCHLMLNITQNRLKTAHDSKICIIGHFPC